MENSIPLPIPALAPCCLGSHTTLPALEEITEEPAFICEDLDGLLREADEGRARDLQEGSSQSVVRSPPRLGSERWRMSRIQILTSKITQVCQDIHDIKLRQLLIT